METVPNMFNFGESQTCSKVTRWGAVPYMWTQCQLTNDTWNASLSTQISASVKTSSSRWTWNAQEACLVRSKTPGMSAIHNVLPSYVSAKFSVQLVDSFDSCLLASLTFVNSLVKTLTLATPASSPIVRVDQYYSLLDIQWSQTLSSTLKSSSWIGATYSISSGNCVSLPSQILCRRTQSQQKISL